jgi:hypothetical protein
VPLQTFERIILDGDGQKRDENPKAGLSSGYFQPGEVVQMQSRHSIGFRNQGPERKASDWIAVLESRTLNRTIKMSSCDRVPGMNERATHGFDETGAAMTALSTTIISLCQDTY